LTSDAVKYYQIAILSITK